MEKTNLLEHQKYLRNRMNIYIHTIQIQIVKYLKLNIEIFTNVFRIFQILKISFILNFDNKTKF
jgi:hypothetical protein